MTKRKSKRNAIDCVAMKRRAQSKIMAATEGMSPKAEIAYFERRAAAGPFQELHRQIRTAAAAKRPAKRGMREG